MIILKVETRCFCFKMELNCWFLWICTIPVAFDLSNVLNRGRNLAHLVVLRNCCFAALISGAAAVAVANKFGLSCV